MIYSNIQNIVLAFCNVKQWFLPFERKKSRYFAKI